MTVVTRDEFAQVLVASQATLSEVAEQDWSVAAGTLEWSCRQTVDHMIDCVFSYAMQVAARAPSGFLPFGELHATADASNRDLITGLRAVGQLFQDVVTNAPSGTTASDGVLSLDVGDWCARAAYELAVHTHDIASGAGLSWELQGDLSTSITASPGLWMFDRAAAAAGTDPWTTLLRGSGRPAWTQGDLSRAAASGDDSLAPVITEPQRDCASRAIAACGPLCAAHGVHPRLDPTPAVRSRALDRPLERHAHAFAQLERWRIGGLG